MFLYRLIVSGSRSAPSTSLGTTRFLDTGLRWPAGGPAAGRSHAPRWKTSKPPSTSTRHTRHETCLTMVAPRWPSWAAPTSASRACSTRCYGARGWPERARRRGGADHHYFLISDRLFVDLPARIRKTSRANDDPGHAGEHTSSTRCRRPPPFCGERKGSDAARRRGLGITCLRWPCVVVATKSQGAARQGGQAGARCPGVGLPEDTGRRVSATKVRGFAP